MTLSSVMLKLFCTTHLRNVCITLYKGLLAILQSLKLRNNYYASTLLTLQASAHPAGLHGYQQQNLMMGMKSTDYVILLSTYPKTSLISVLSAVLVYQILFCKRKLAHSNDVHTLKFSLTHYMEVYKVVYKLNILRT